MVDVKRTDALKPMERMSQQVVPHLETQIKGKKTGKK
jgi:hypothetical protein